MTIKLPSTTRSLPIALIRAREGVMAPIREMLAEDDMTEQQWRVIRVLAEHGPLDATSLAERASLLVPSLTRILKNMRDRELITQRQHDTDRRRQVVALTEAGQQILDRNSDRAAQIVVGFKAQLGEANYEQLLDLLERLDPSKQG